MEKLTYKFRLAPKISAVPVQNSQFGGTLVYVLMLVTVGSMMVYYSQTQNENLIDVDTKLKKGAFVRESVAEIANQIQCPSGVIRVSEGSCKPEKGLKLSMGYLRSQLVKSQIVYQQLFNSLPPSAKILAMGEIIEMRMDCYRTQSTIDPKTKKQYVTKYGDEPCESIKGIKPTLTPFPEAGSLKNGALQLVSNLYTIKTRVLPAIEIKKVESKRTLDTKIAEYKPLSDNYQTQLALCKPFFDKSEVCPTQNNLNDAKALAINKQNEADLAATIYANYDSLGTFVQGGVIEKGLSIITNVQLASMQQKGGYLAKIMREGERVGNDYIRDNIPAADSIPDGTVFGDPDPSSEQIPFRYMIISPFCEDIATDPSSRNKKFIFKAKIDNAQIEKAYSTEYDRSMLKKAMRKLLYEPKSTSDDWVSLPANFAPSDCKVTEEVDPIGSVDDSI